LLLVLLLLAGVEVALVVPTMSSGRVVLRRGAMAGERREGRVWWTRRCKAEAGVCLRCPPRGNIKAFAVFSSPKARRRMERVSLSRFMVLYWGGRKGGGRRMRLTERGQWQW
jgi:hypothetical protein